MLRIALGTLRSRKGGILGALVGVTLAVALVVSSGIVVESTLRARVPVERLAGASIVVQRSRTLHLRGSENDVMLREQTRVDGRSADRLGAIPGVAHVVTDRSFATRIVAPDGQPLGGESGSRVPGHGWSSAALASDALTRGRPPRGAADVVLERGLASAWSVEVGERVRIRTAFGGGLFTVAGVVTPSPEYGPRRAPAAFFRDDVAAALSGTGARVGLIAITVRPGADVGAVARRVREAVEPSGLRVLTGSKRGEAESLDATIAREDVLSGLSVFASFAAFAAIFVIASAFALSVQQRHRELALLRAIGATPRQVRRMVAAEALVVALLGALVAAPLALVVAVAERRIFVHAGMLPSDFELVVGRVPFALGLLTAIVTTQLAAFASGRRAARISPVEALREASVESRRLSVVRGLAGLAALIVGFAVFVGTTRDVSGGGGDDAPAAGLVWMLAATLLGPLLALPFVVLGGLVLQGVGRGPGLLARANSRANLRRLTSIATPLMLSVSLACALLVSRTVVERATGGQVARSVTAEHVLVPSGGDGLMPDVAASARRLDGVGHVAATFGTSVVVAAGGGNPIELPARAVDGSDLAPAVDLGVTAGSMGALHGPSVAVDVRRARQLGWRVGERVHLWLGDGTSVRLRVVALFQRPLGFGELILPRDAVEAHVSNPLDDAVFVTNGDRSANVVFERLARARPEVEILTRSRYVERVDAAVRQQSIAVFVLLGVVVLFCAVAAVNALSAAISERARELELLRLIGATRRQLTRMIRFEVALVVAFATTVGVLTAAPGVVVFSYGKTGSFVPAVPAWIYAGLPASAALLAFAASVLPTRKALRAGRGCLTSGAE